MPNLSKVGDREKLKPRRDPYWSKVSKGCYIGFRKMTAGSEGNWSARFFDDAQGKQVYKALGEFSELKAQERHDAAQKAAVEWFAHLGKGGTAEAFTVRAACARYVAHVQERKGTKAAADIQRRLNQYVLTHTRLAESEVAKLTPSQVEMWRRGLRELPTKSGGARGQPRTDSTLNRDMTCFRAALNLAYADGLVTSDFAWKSKLKPFKNADRQRDLYLDPEQRRDLIRQAPPELAAFLRGLCLLPVRPGALSKLTVGQFDKRLKTLSVGKDKTGKDRKIALPDTTASFFSSLATDKLPFAPLFSRADGKAWGKDIWKKPVKTAVAAAGLPESATCYTLRHSVITDLVHDGLDTLTVAQLAGTSVLMIERHYGHLTQEQARKALALLAI